MQKKVAIVGAAFRLPGSTTENYWSNLLEGRDLVTEVEEGRWSKEAFLHPDKNHPGTSYTFAAGSIGDVSGFDAGFFGISPREAAVMDPQQRLMLELAWETFEHAGIPPSRLRGSRCGVYLGVASIDYAYRIVDDLAVVNSSSGTGNTSSIVANRLSYVYDLRGPSMSIDTACSSSLVAFHQACRAIQSGEVDQALTGGISLHLHPYGFLVFSKASMLSRRGRCNTFDAAGDGYARSEGAGLFLLKEHDQALADGDRILAVVAGSAVNTDGRKNGLTVPSESAQVALMREAYQRAGLSADDVDYLEAHGTGTPVGDPIESRAIGEALGRRRSGGPLPIGSVKSNMGHLETASGVAGLTKALYCLLNREVPATIGIRTLNPAIAFDELNLAVVTERLPLRPEGTLTVGVNSFGFGGANAHVILQSHTAPATPDERPTTTTRLPLLVGARDDKALRENAARLADWLERHPDALYDAAYHSLYRRERQPLRAALYSESASDAAQQLRAFATAEGDEPENAGLARGRALDEAGSAPVFVYSGNGCQWQGMGQGLLADPLFRAAVAEVDEAFRPLAGYSLLDDLDGRLADERGYALTELAQPALFAVQVGVTRLLESLGVKPAAVFGHSVGEVAAAWASGALDLASATSVIYHRSRLQGLTAGAGEMTAVGLDGEQAQQLIDELALGDAAWVAGANSFRGATLAGMPEALARIEQVLAGRQVFARRLDLNYAFHCPAMDPIRAELLASLAQLAPAPTRLPMHSTVTGQRIDGDQLGADYWWRNIRMPVLFQTVSERLVEDGHPVFVEIGAHPILRGYLADALATRERDGRVIATLARGESQPARVTAAAAQLLVAGAELDLAGAFPVAGRFVDLPGYAWQRERYWHETTPETGGSLFRSAVHPLLGHPLRDRALAWESILDTQRFPTLGDHVVGEAVLFPGAGFVEVALAAALQFQPGEYVDIEELEIRAPLLLADSPAKKLRIAIDESDGSLGIQSRTLASDEAWTPHLVAKIRGEARGAGLAKVAPALPQRPADFDGAAHLALTSAVGLHYGPAYRAVECGWLEGERVLARLRLPEEIAAELNVLHLHPALLDCAFQLITPLLGEVLSTNNGLAFIPVRLGRISFVRGSRPPRLIQVSLRRRSAHSLLADFDLFDEQGTPVVSIQAARFKGVRLHKAEGRPLSLLGYAALPMPYAGSEAASTTIAAPLEARLRAGLPALGEEPTLQRYVDEVDPLLDSLCAAFLLQAVEAAGGRIDAATRAEWERHVPAAYVEWLLAGAEADGYLIREADGWRAVEAELPAEAIWRELFRSYPECFQIVHSVGRIGLRLGQLLAGSTTLDALLPRESAPFQLARQALGAATPALLDALGAQIGDWQRELAGDRRLRILELGAGGAPLAVDLYPRLDLDRCDYAYCAEDLGELDLATDDFPGIAWRGLDDAPLGPFDLVLLPTDFAGLPYLRALLACAQARLANGGSLLLVAQHATRWADFVFGADERWWVGADALQPVSRQLGVEAWRQELARAGLACETLIELLPERRAGGYLLLASRLTPLQAPAVEARAWALVGGDARREALAAALREAGQQVDFIPPGDADALAAALAALPHTPSQLVMLDGLGAVGEAGQVARCMLAAALSEACERLDLAADCWLLSLGASAGQLLPDSADDGLADAMFWGFARTLANESPKARIRLLDLAPGLDLARAAGALLHADAEVEMALDASGARHVPRLRVQPESLASAAGDADEQVSLGFELPGQLRNLRWERKAPASMGADQLDVEVQATGLNFRDVMYALGLLSDEAIENGFSGPTLGFEFAGVVKGVGAQVEGGFKPGDRVVGFGPASFANRLVTPANAVAAIPAHLSFEAAATIPSTFFTVYYALEYLARLEPGEKILIHGAAGGVGIAAVQIAQWKGAEVYATAGSDEKRDFLRLLGVQHIFDSRSLAYADEILAVTGGRGVDVVLNSLAGEAIHRNLSVLKPFGRFLELGKRDFYENTRIGLRPFRNNISYFGIDADQLMSERPALTRRLFGEMMALFEDGTLCPLPYRAFDANDVVDAFRYMQQARQIGKVVVTYRNDLRKVHSAPIARGERLALRGDACYLVTGGLTGFGLRTAQWLIDKGARHLVLVGRRGPATEEAQPYLRAWREQGLDVRAESCDITDREQLTAVLARIAASAAPLAGVVHAATVFADGLIRNMTAEQVQQVLAPKARGAAHLHALTEHLALDFFVLFSSATTLFGNPGQANYVAANHWLEALARHRLARGLPATCVLWGAIDDAGFLARNEQIKQALQGRMGGDALSSAVALDALERLLVERRSGLGVLELDWKPLARFLPTAGTPKFAELATLQGADAAEEGDGGDLQALLDSLPPDELHAAICEMLKQEIGEILRIAPGKIESSRPLQEMGLDSLMGVEMVVALESRFGVRLPVMALSESATVDKLAHRLLAHLQGDGEEHAAGISDTLAKHGGELSDEALESLGRELASENGQAARLIN